MLSCSSDAVRDEVRQTRPWEKGREAMTEQAVGKSRIEIAPAGQGASKGDIDGVTTAARNYIEGFTHGDADRHARA